MKMHGHHRQVSEAVAIFGSYAERFIQVPEADELLIEQFQALRKQVPLMYAIMAIDAAFLSFATFDKVPAVLGLGVPLVLLVLAMSRAVVWLRRRHVTPNAEDIRRYLHTTVVFAGVFSSAFGGWGLLLLDPANPIQMFAVALYIFVGAIGCCYCLQPLPAAGRLVLLFGAMPVTIRLLLSDDWYLFGVASNFMIVAALVSRTLSTNHQGFIEVLTSRAELVAEQARARLAEQKAQQLAYHDALTGLRNRRALIEHLDSLRLRASERETVALLILDLDHFKSVNDVHGHPEGDRLLKHVAERLMGVVGGAGIAYRLGGDEFAVTLDLDRSEHPTAISMAGLIVGELATPFHIGTRAHHIGGSVGVSFFPDDAIDSETLLRRADIALYKAKALGRSRHLAFEAGMDAEIARRSYLERDLRRDLKEGAFRPWYQPIVNLKTGKITGFEMLARWHDGARLRVGPDQFIPIAEECGLIGELMLVLLDQACREAATWGDNLVLSINMSPTQLKDRTFAEAVLAVLEETGFPATRLKLEITENALISDPENAKAMIGFLKQQGVRLALDDFGTGYSSIRHLRILPFDNIKIDRTFISELESDHEALRMVQGMIGLASSLDLPVVAEGIERQTTLDVLKSLGCTEGQGFLFGRPMDAAAVTHLLRRRVDDGPLAA